MTVDVELSLNRFGLGTVASNKFQIGPFRISLWDVKGKHSLSFEINWKRR